MENALVVKNQDGKEVTVNVIDIIEDTVNNKQYVCYNFTEMDGVFISRLVETEEGYSLETVTEEERDAVESSLAQTVPEE